MKLGLFTACLGRQSVDQVANWAAQAGYQALELAAWPAGSAHVHQAAHLNAANFTTADAARIHDLMDRYSLTICAVTFCENNLHPDREQRETNHRHLRHVIDAAAEMNVPRVGTFIGRDTTRPIADNLKLAEQYLTPLVDYAAERGVRLLAENCPMEGWNPDGYPGNLAYSPELWDWMAELGFHLTYDPSHLPWLGIDPLDALLHALESGIVGHVQAKDIEIDKRARTHYGVFGKTVGRTSPTDVGWWRYRVPGRGQIDWASIIRTLDIHGYDGTIAVEHEDPVWSGTPDRVQQGLLIAAKTLQPLISQVTGAIAAGDTPGLSAS